MRIPVIPNFNADEKELEQIAKFLKKLSITSIELLPYHSMGEHKWEALGVKPSHFVVPTKEQMEELKKIFK